MAISIETVADKTYNLLKGYGFKIDTFNKVGEVVGDPSEAIRFFVEDPNLLVTLNVPDEEVRLSISKNTEQTDKLRKQLGMSGYDFVHEECNCVSMAKNSLKLYEQVLENNDNK